MSMDENVLSDITVFNLAPKDFIRNITDAMESVYSALECPVAVEDAMEESLEWAVEDILNQNPGLTKVGQFKNIIDTYTKRCVNEAKEVDLDTRFDDIRDEMIIEHRDGVDPNGLTTNVDYEFPWSISQLGDWISDGLTEGIEDELG